MQESKTDRDARLCSLTKGTAAKLSCMGHVLKENCSGLVVNAQVTKATATAERGA